MLMSWMALEFEVNEESGRGKTWKRQDDDEGKEGDLSMEDAPCRSKWTVCANQIATMLR